MKFEEIQTITTALGPLTTFGTVDPDGTPHLVAVIPSWVDGRLVFGSRTDSRKVRNVLERPQASMHFATPGEAFPDTVLLKGSARVVDGDEERKALWTSGFFPYLPMMYAGPDDTGLRFVEFVPARVVIVRNGGRGPVERWRAG